MRCPAKDNGRCEQACREFCCMLFSREAWEAVQEDKKKRAEKEKD